MINRNWYRHYKFKKTVENDDKNNSETQGKDQSKNKSTVEISKSVTKTVQLIWSVVELVLQKKNSQERTVCRSNETNKIENSVKAHTTGKTNNMEKSLFTVPTIKKLILQINQLEVKKSSDYHDMEAVEFLDHTNFDNGDFDNDVIDYIEGSIYLCYIFK